MDIEYFWSLVETADATAEGNMEAKCSRISALVGRLPPEQATAFGAHFDRLMASAYSWPLWGAAYVICGGCSDDSFTDFRSALISRGRRQFHAALRDPDTLASVQLDPDDWAYEGYQYAVNNGIGQAGATRQTPEPPPHPSGTPWLEDSVYTLFPELAAKYA